MIRNFFLTLLFCLTLSFSLKAQLSIFDIPFIAESSQPEMFYGDPYYDADGNLLYYAIGDNFRVYYSYDENGLLQKRSIYELVDFVYRYTKFEYGWELFREDVYRYEAGRLKEQRIRAVNRSRRQDNDMGDVTLYEAMIKKVTYDSKKNTEKAVIVFPKMDWDTNKYHYEDTIVVISYLNQDNLPIKRFVSNGIGQSYGHKKDYQKLLYKYDEKNRLTRIELSAATAADPLGHVLWVNNIEYENGKVIYTQIEGAEGLAAYADPDDPFMLKELNAEYLAKNQKNKISISIMDVSAEEDMSRDKCILSYVLLYDEKERLTERHILLNSDTLIASNYKRNGELLEYKQDYKQEMPQKYFRSSILPDIFEARDFRGLEDFVYTVSKDDKNCINVKRYDRQELFDEINNCYLSDMKLSSWELIKYKNGKKTSKGNWGEVSYNADGLSGEHILYGLVSSPNEVDGRSEKVKTPISKQVFKNDKDGKLKSVDRYYFNLKTNKWELITDELD